jgi:hypothetical protein
VTSLMPSASSAVPVTNANASPVLIYITAGASSVTIAGGRHVSGLVIPAGGNATVRLEPQDTITWTGSAQPSYVTDYGGR